MKKPTIRFFVGGPDFHPVEQQARMIAQWLGDGYECDIREGHTAFEDLDSCDLLVLMGLIWTGWEADGVSHYQPLEARHKDALEAHVAQGKPLITHHGATLSYDDWPRFGELCGVAWILGETQHSPEDVYLIKMLPTRHPILRNVTDFTAYDEIYYDLRWYPNVAWETHAVSDWRDAAQPMVRAGRRSGGGKAAYLANGHNLKTFECPALGTLWQNAVRWSLDPEEKP